MCHNLDLAIAHLRDVDGVAEVSDTALNFDLIVQELFKGGEVENLIADRLGAVDGVLKAEKVSNEKGYGSYLKQRDRMENKIKFRDRSTTYLLRHLCRFAFLCFLRIRIFLAYCSSSRRRTKAGGEQQSGCVHTVTGAISNERRRSQRS
jgi:hypothetical protein